MQQPNLISSPRGNLVNPNFTTFDRPYENNFNLQ
jgi:hypothetical protein